MVISRNARSDLDARSNWLQRQEQNYRKLSRNPVQSIDLVQHRHQVRLREDTFEGRAGFVDGVQKSHQLSAKLPVACRDRAGQQPSSMTVTFIQLFQVVQNKQV